MEEKGRKWVFVDCHAHPDNINLVDKAIERANIEVWINSTGPEDIGQAIAISSRVRSKLFVGLHPAEAERSMGFLNDLGKLLERADGIGEIGLDGKCSDSMDVQLEVLRFQLGLAEKRSLPVVLHSRNAVSRVLEEISTYDLKSVLFHWFSGSWVELKQVLDRGYYISVGPTILYSKKSGKVLKASYEQHLLLLETDSPVYYAPVRKEADPTLIVSVYLSAAQILGLTFEEFVDEMWKASRIFMRKAFKSIL